MRKEKKKLMGIANHVKCSHNVLIKVFWYLVGFYYGGSLKEKYQNWFAKKIGFSPKNLTIVNSVGFGFVGAIIFFSSKGYATWIVGEYFVSWLSSVFHLAVNSLLFLYVIYNLLQNFFRIFYAESTGRAIANFNMFGAIANIFHYLVVVFHRDVLKKKHEFHG